VLALVAVDEDRSGFPITVRFRLSSIRASDKIINNRSRAELPGRERCGPGSSPPP
jgi:hypothetical protein